MEKRGLCISQRRRTEIESSAGKTDTMDAAGQQSATGQLPAGAIKITVWRNTGFPYCDVMLCYCLYRSDSGSTGKSTVSAIRSILR